MDDLTILSTTKVCNVRLLRKLQENIERARMKIKLSKSRSISIIKGNLSDHRFHVGKELIPTVSEEPQVEQLRKEVASGLENIDRTLLPGKLKCFCMQLVSSYVRKWLGLPRCLSSIGFYGKGMLHLPISSLVEEYKCAKVRLEMMLLDLSDPFWIPLAATEQAMAALRHKDIVGRVQEGRSSLGLGASTPVWSKASPSQRRKMVVQEVCREEEARRCAQAVAQANQGQWMAWEGVEKRKISWKELWEMEAFRASFTIRAAYNVLPSPANLSQWYAEDMVCPLCPSLATLKHILVGCKTSLTQGHYTWRHNQVLISDSRQLGRARYWKMLADLNKKLCFPAEIAATNL
ncbi:hypothetical protein Q7C36_005635 [Tachysurus vachellii]|uniref:Reverse transcriptase zinc-binding domain-containing protein n=1 Tax=Tachysurus vachellii TaxID=175792 RepID=A0AA88NED0_TACVA|nr:hypothetical protein Q7C36_005635 [Tachysurus vachellii]